MLKAIQVITINGVQKKCKVMIEKNSSENYRAYIAFEYNKKYEPFYFLKEDADKLNLLDDCCLNFINKNGQINKVDNQISDIYSTPEIKEIFKCHVTES